MFKFVSSLACNENCFAGLYTWCLIIKEGFDFNGFASFLVCLFLLLFFLFFSGLRERLLMLFTFFYYLCFSYPVFFFW